MNIVLHWGYIQVHMEGDKCTLGFWIQGTHICIMSIEELWAGFCIDLKIIYCSRDNFYYT